MHRFSNNPIVDTIFELLNDPTSVNALLDLAPEAFNQTFFSLLLELIRVAREEDQLAAMRFRALAQIIRLSMEVKGIAPQKETWWKNLRVRLDSIMDEQEISKSTKRSVLLLDDTGAIYQQTFMVFVNPDDKNQQDIFRAIKCSGRSDIIDAYVSAALTVVTSDAEYGEQDRTLTSLVGFVNFGDEGAMEWTTHARDVLGDSYYRIHNELSEYFQNEQIPLNGLHKVFMALASMDYFCVKRTMMMGFIFYEHPKNAIWLVERLKVVRRALSLTDSEMAWYSLAFLTHSFRELQEVLLAPKTKEQDHALSEILDLIHIEISKWLLCSDWRVVKEAITYCALAKLSDNREIIEQLELSKDDTTSNIAKQALEVI
jgi:hypothetical protein